MSSPRCASSHRSSRSTRCRPRRGRPNARLLEHQPGHPRCGIRLERVDVAVDAPGLTALRRREHAFVKAADRREAPCVDWQLDRLQEQCLRATLASGQRSHGAADRDRRAVPGRRPQAPVRRVLVFGCDENRLGRIRLPCLAPDVERVTRPQRQKQHGRAVGRPHRLPHSNIDSHRRQRSRCGPAISYANGSLPVWHLELVAKWAEKSLGLVGIPRPEMLHCHIGHAEITRTGRSEAIA